MQQIKSNNLFIISLCVIYLSALIIIVFFLPPHERKVKVYQYHFIPLQSTIAEIKNPDQYDTPGYWKVFATGILGNLLLFVPFGFLSKLLFPNKKNNTLFFYAFSTSVLIELIQLIFHLGVCDIDDVILNSLGSFLGILIYKAIKSVTKKQSILISQKS